MTAPTFIKNATTVLVNIILGVAILIFAKGFFPHKAVLPGLAKWSEDSTAPIYAPFDKVIFMVVDALRSDFVYSNASSFHFTQSLIRSGAAVPFTGHASPPTITMPRVKSITTGSVPSFLDLVLNFAESDTSSTLATQDSWLAQLKAKQGGKLIMYGDDTWLRLFPGFFGRADGTTSFFVSDFTEVDNNVTRHVPDELAQDDWNGMILHYLGLDHIGHKTGPKGPNMPSKQREMDLIVHEIYRAMERNSHLQSTVLVLLGDHGMNEGGNHGANSAGEVSTALAFISPKFKSMFQGYQSPQRPSEDFKYYNEVDQSDVAPTLAALLGFPIPKNSLGAIIPEMLHMWTDRIDRYTLLYRNAEQIQKIASATYPEAFESIQDLSMCTDKAALSDKQQLACKWLSVKELHKTILSEQFLLVRDGSSLVRSFLKEAQEHLSGTASKYDEKSMLIGAILAVLCSLPPRSSYDIRRNKTGLTTIAFFFMQLTYSLTMFASSYVEEEHQFWYWITSAWLIFLAIKQQRVETTRSTLGSFCRNIVVAGTFGVVRRMNQTGQKYAGDADLVSELFAKMPWLLWTFIFIAYAIIPWRMRSRLVELDLKQLAGLPVLVTASAFLFKIAFTGADAPELLKGIRTFGPVLSFATRYPLNSLARLVFLGLGNLLCLAVYAEKPWAGPDQFSAFLAMLHDVVSLLLVTQTRTLNIPMILFFHFQVRVLYEGRTLQPFELLLTMLMLQYSSFFALGGTNAISSVDLSNAYNGVGGYNVLMVGILTFVSNWAGPIWWASATACILGPSMRSRTGNGSNLDWFAILTHFAAVHTATVMAACYILRQHLFVWTVFSPKYLYMMAWIFAQHMGVNGLFSLVISKGWT